MSPPNFLKTTSRLIASFILNCAYKKYALSKLHYLVAGGPPIADVHWKIGEQLINSPLPLLCYTTDASCCAAIGSMLDGASDVS
jgi:hypothetical protein